MSEYSQTDIHFWSLIIVLPTFIEILLFARHIVANFPRTMWCLLKKRPILSLMKVDFMAQIQRDLNRVFKGLAEATSLPNSFLNISLQFSEWAFYVASSKPAWYSLTHNVLRTTWCFQRWGQIRSYELYFKWLVCAIYFLRKSSSQAPNAFNNIP